ncbi:MAG TPA: hypothetical protein PKJ75_02830 [Methanosarcina vacuolata]|nr:hypothetical protein [Methanosarcina vacuolata]HNW37768.1 hypothetical protein [Methanosarcina vacuolata]
MTTDFGLDIVVTAPATSVAGIYGISTDATSGSCSICSFQDKT